MNCRGAANDRRWPERQCTGMFLPRGVHCEPAGSRHHELPGYLETTRAVNSVCRHVLRVVATVSRTLRASVAGSVNCLVAAERVPPAGCLRASATGVMNFRSVPKVITWSKDKCTGMFLRRCGHLEGGGHCGA